MPKTRLQEEVIKNPIPAPTRNGVQYILAANHFLKTNQTRWNRAILLAGRPPHPNKALT